MSIVSISSAGRRREGPVLQRKENSSRHQRPWLDDTEDTGRPPYTVNIIGFIETTTLYRTPRALCGASDCHCRSAETLHCASWPGNRENDEPTLVSHSHRPQETPFTTLLQSKIAKFTPLSAPPRRRVAQPKPAAEVIARASREGFVHPGSPRTSIPSEALHVTENGFTAVARNAIASDGRHHIPQYRNASFLSDATNAPTRADLTALASSLSGLSKATVVRLTPPDSQSPSPPKKTATLRKPAAPSSDSSATLSDPEEKFQTVPRSPSPEHEDEDDLMKLFELAAEEGRLQEEECKAPHPLPRPLHREFNSPRPIVPKPSKDTSRARSTSSSPPRRKNLTTEELFEIFLDRPPPKPPQPAFCAPKPTGDWKEEDFWAPIKAPDRPCFVLDRPHEEAGPWESVTYESPYAAVEPARAEIRPERDDDDSLPYPSLYASIGPTRVEIRSERDDDDESADGDDDTDSEPDEDALAFFNAIETLRLQAEQAKSTQNKSLIEQWQSTHDEIILEPPPPSRRPRHTTISLSPPWRSSSFDGPTEFDEKKATLLDVNDEEAEAQAPPRSPRPGFRRFRELLPKPALEQNQVDALVAFNSTAPDYTPPVREASSSFSEFAVSTVSDGEAKRGSSSNSKRKIDRGKLLLETIRYKYELRDDNVDEPSAYARMEPEDRANDLEMYRLTLVEPYIARYRGVGTSSDEEEINGAPYINNACAGMITFPEKCERPEEFWHRRRRNRTAETALHVDRAGIMYWELGRGDLFRTRFTPLLPRLYTAFERRLDMEENTVRDAQGFVVPLLPRRERAETPEIELEERVRWHEQRRREEMGEDARRVAEGLLPRFGGKSMLGRAERSCDLRQAIWEMEEREEEERRDDARALETLFHPPFRNGPRLPPRDEFPELDSYRAERGMVPRRYPMLLSVPQEMELQEALPVIGMGYGPVDADEDAVFWAVGSEEEFRGFVVGWGVRGVPAVVVTMAEEEGDGEGGWDWEGSDDEDGDEEDVGEQDWDDAFASAFGTSRHIRK